MDFGSLVSINIGECSFGASTVNYMGQQIDEHGSRPRAEKVTAIRGRSVDQLKRFLRTLKFNMHHLPSIAC